MSTINDVSFYTFSQTAFYALDCGEQERPHLLQRQAGPAGQAPDGDRGCRAAQEHALGGRHRPGYCFQLNKKQPRFPLRKRGCGSVQNKDIMI